VDVIVAPPVSADDGEPEAVVGLTALGFGGGVGGGDGGAEQPGGGQCGGEPACVEEEIPSVEWTHPRDSRGRRNGKVVYESASFVQCNGP
jgi:hypothetical protein